MLSYQVLCQSIADWKAGQRPTSAPRPPRAAPQEVHELDSGMVTLDDQEVETSEDDGTGVEGGSDEEPEAAVASETAGDDEGIPID